MHHELVLTRFGVRLVPMAPERAAGLLALRADARNARSCAAIERLGAVREGTLRGHRIAADGYRADTANFSVLAPEWPAVRDSLLARLDR
jgi:RimJ/RimL family protein N-acetyltransferase